MSYPGGQPLCPVSQQPVDTFRTGLANGMTATSSSFPSSLNALASYLDGQIATPCRQISADGLNALFRFGGGDTGASLKDFVDSVHTATRHVLRVRVSVGIR